MKYFAFPVLVITAVLIKAEIKLPNYIAPCKAKDSFCLKNLLKELAPRLKEGIREFNLPSIDPADLPDCNMSDYSSAKMPYNGFIKDLRYKGASDYEVLKLEIDPDELIFNLVLFFPHLIMTGYEIFWMQGFGMEVNGEGIMTEYYDNVTISLSLNGEKYPGTESEQHIKWTEDLINVSMGTYTFVIDPSFKDRDNYREFLNMIKREYDDEFKHEVELYIKYTLGAFIFEKVNLVHEIFPINVLYSPDEINRSDL